MGVHAQNDGDGGVGLAGDDQVGGRGGRRRRRLVGVVVDDGHQRAGDVGDPVRVGGSGYVHRLLPFHHQVVDRLQGELGPADGLPGGDGHREVLHGVEVLHLRLPHPALAAHGNGHHDVLFQPQPVLREGGAYRKKGRPAFFHAGLVPLRFGIRIHAQNEGGSAFRLVLCWFFIPVARLSVITRFPADLLFGLRIAARVIPAVPGPAVSGRGRLRGGVGGKRRFGVRRRFRTGDAGSRNRGLGRPDRGGKPHQDGKPARGQPPPN